MLDRIREYISRLFKREDDNEMYKSYHGRGILGFKRLYRVRFSATPPSYGFNIVSHSSDYEDAVWDNTLPNMLIVNWGKSVYHILLPFKLIKPALGDNGILYPREYSIMVLSHSSDVLDNILVYWNYSAANRYNSNVYVYRIFWNNLMKTDRDILLSSEIGPVSIIDDDYVEAIGMYKKYRILLLDGGIREVKGYIKSSEYVYGVGPITKFIMSIFKSPRQIITCNIRGDYHISGDITDTYSPTVDNIVNFLYRHINGPKIISHELIEE